MKTLRLMTTMALAAGLGLVGCADSGRSDTDDGGMDEDTGVELMDGGSGGDDSGSGGGDDGGGGGGDDSGSGGGDDGGGGGTCPEGACDLLTNDGCDVGQACQYLDGPTCVEAGIGGDDEPCSGPADCQEGFGCVGPSGGDTFCQPYCCGPDDHCPTGQRCNVDVGDGSDTVLFQVCELPDDCDLVEQTGCESEEGCYPSSMDGSVSCDPAGSATQGESCEARNACAKGYGCIDDPGMCAKFCDPTASAPDCPDGTSCGGLTGFPEDVGVCVSSSG